MSDLKPTIPYFLLLLILSAVAIFAAVDADSRTKGVYTRTVNNTLVVYNLGARTVCRYWPNGKEVCREIWEPEPVVTHKAPEVDWSQFTPIEEESK